MIMKMSILSERQASGEQRLANGGKIRPGIKVLTRNAEKNPTAVRLYQRGVEQRLKFSEIEKQIEAATSIKSALYPRNTPYFNVAASDFGMPELAGIIVEKYGEIREGDEKKQLYRFPVVFHSGELSDVYPNSYRRFGGQPDYHSHYGDDGVRYCRYRPEVTREMMAEQKANRIKRMPRRETEIRGQCVPNRCAEFLAGQCRFRGQLYFYIPGIPSTGLLMMETTSEYAAEAIWTYLDGVQAAYGSIPRVNPVNPGQPIFYMTKVQEPRSYFDEDGRKCNGLQWVPRLQADLDLGMLISTGARPAIQAQPAPVAWLAAPKGMPEAPIIDDAPQASASASAPSAGSIMPPVKTPEEDLRGALADLGYSQESEEFEVIARYLDLKVGTGWEAAGDGIEKALEVIRPFAIVGKECAQKLVAITISVEELGLNHKEFKKYCGLKHGKKYTGNATILNAIIDELKELFEAGPEVASSYIKQKIAGMERKAA